jgi:hypothetical protein
MRIEIRKIKEGWHYGHSVKRVHVNLFSQMYLGPDLWCSWKMEQEREFSFGLFKIIITTRLPIQMEKMES